MTTGDGRRRMNGYLLVQLGLVVLLIIFLYRAFDLDLGNPALLIIGVLLVFVGMQSARKR